MLTALPRDRLTRVIVQEATVGLVGPALLSSRSVLRVFPEQRRT